jgi:hypothetical protein
VKPDPLPYKLSIPAAKDIENLLRYTLEKWVLALLQTDARPETPHRLRTRASSSLRAGIARDRKPASPLHNLQNGGKPSFIRTISSFQSKAGCNISSDCLTCCQ